MLEGDDEPEEPIDEPWMGFILLFKTNSNKEIFLVTKSFLNNKELTEE